MDNKTEKKELPTALVKTHDKITKIYADSKDLKNSEDNLYDLSGALSKQWGRFEPQFCQATMDHMFKLAAERMSNDEDKNVLKGLR